MAHTHAAVNPMTVIASLIDRLEKASGPDRELDLAIHRATRRCKPTQEELSYERIVQFDALDNLSHVFVDSDAHESGYCLGVRRVNYTASIDLALTLVPPGTWLEIETGTQQKPPYFEWPVLHFVSQSSERGLGTVQAKTLALSICIAALKAREASHG